MKKTLLSIIAFALAFVMAMTSLPVGAGNYFSEHMHNAVENNDCIVECNHSAINSHNSAKHLSMMNADAEDHFTSSVNRGYYNTATNVYARIEQLYGLIGGKYCTVNQQACVYGSHSWCDNCKNSNYVNAQWFKALFGSVSVNNFPQHFTPTGNIYPTGWTCAGFANFAEWYIFAENNNEKIYTYKVGTYNSNYLNISRNARCGDVLRFDDRHSAIFISCDESNGIYVMDSNWRLGDDGASRVRKHYISYSKYSTVTISRCTKDPDTVPEPNPTTPPPEHTCNKGELVFFESSHPHCNCYRCSICGQIWRDTNSSNFDEDCSQCQTHTCNRGELVFFESSHPHCNCYRCSICGQIWRDTNSSNHVDSCTDCNRPAKPVISAVNSVYGPGQNIVFRWTTGANTTHCNFVLYIKENGEWKVRQRTNYANSGLSVTASNGDYRVLVLAYNSNMWEADGSDWLHTYSDYVYYSVKSYTITWKNYDGTTLETDTNVPHGTTPTYNGSTPSRPATAQYTYTFSGWSPTVAAATGNKTYTAQYNSTVNKYTVTFKNWDGTVLKTQTVNYGNAATAPANPTRPGYTFTGWDRAFNNVTSNLTVNAQFTINTYTVTFKDWDGTTLKTQTVNYGSAATAPANPSRPGYTFTGWDKAFNNVTSNLVVTAQYASAVPDKPIVAANGGYDLSAAVEGWTSVLVDWNNYGSNATHFDVKAYDANTNELIETVSNLTARGYSFRLPVGHYKFTVTAKNMNVNPSTSVTSDMSEAVEVKDYRYGFYSASGIVTYQGHSYAILSEIKTSDWHKAKELCEYLGGHLATITSAGENAVIQDLIFSHSNYTAGTFLGATNEGNGNDWEWITGEPFDYTNWAANEPSNWLGLEHYLSMYNSDGTWADVRSGNWNRQIVIEFDYVFGSYPVEVVATDNYNGHEYTMFRNIGLTWQEAKTFCELRGGTLVCINDAAEQNFVSQLASEIEFGYAYIGATDAANDGTWVWLDGSPVTYSNWGGAEPNGEENENIAIMRLCTYNYGTWMDLTGENQLCYIMEKAVEVPATEPPTNPPVTEPPITPAPDAPQIIVGSKTATQGSTVTVDVSLLNNPGIVSMALTVDFDERLELASVTDTGLLPGQVHSPTMGNPYVLSWVNDTATENFTADGVIVTLTFDIPEDMPVGEYPITISYDLENYDIYNCDVETVEFAVVNGKVNVIDVLIGDVNTDTKVNALDRLYLTRFLAKWADYPEAVINMIAADVNVDTKVNALDRLILTRHLAKWAGYETLPYSAKSIKPRAAMKEGDGEPTIIIDSVTAQPGEESVIKVRLENNPGIVSMMLTVDYDPALELVAVNDTGLLPGKVHAPNLDNPYTLCWVNDTALENYTVNGSIVELVFKLADSAVPGEYSVTISYDNDNYDIYNYEVETVDFAVVNGGITVEEPAQPTHTVTFMDGISGTVIAEIVVTHGEAATAPQAPVHTGYIFTSWDADFSNITEDTTVTAQYGLRGDINESKTVDISDVILALRISLGLITPTDSQLILGDMDNGHNIDVSDVIEILRISLGLSAS